MTDHFHLLLTVDSDLTIERAVQFIKGAFAFGAGRALGFRSPVWQKGFSEIRVTDAAAYERIRMYIYNNPVVRGLVLEPAEFPFSSAHAGFEVDAAPQRLKPASQIARDGMAKAMP